MITDKTAEQLRLVVQDWRTKLHALDEAAVRHKPSPDRWSIAEVVGHMVDSACNNHQRFVRAQDSESLMFPRYDQNAWVTAGAYQQSDWSSLVELWFLYNLQLAGVMRNIPDARLQTPCTITPSESCTLEFLVVDYLDHLNHHLAKIEERIG